MNRFDCSIKFYSDPILFTGKNGTPVVKFRAEIRRDDGSGVDYFNFVAFGKRAEFIKKYFQKRSCAVVEGTLRNDDWKKEDGTKVYRDVVVVKRIEFAGSKKKYENEIQNGNGSRPGVPPVQNAQREPAYYKQNSAADFASPYTGYVYGSAPRGAGKHVYRRGYVSERTDRYDTRLSGTAVIWTGKHGIRIPAGYDNLPYPGRRRVHRAISCYV